jgi:extradiol dioxygenase family protein
MSWKDWHRAVDHMNYIGVDFKVAPYTASKGTQEESAIFCLYDPSDNILEFRAYRNI